MDLEDLTKSQVILLALLVSFVTSIATGIVTVTLLDEAPSAVTQNINRVVERTVERVVPAETQNAGAASTETETTVVVKENDLITESIDRNAQSLARVIQRRTTAEGGDAVIGLGMFITRGGIVATDGSIISPGGTYAVRTHTGEVYNTTVQDSGDGTPTALLRVLPEEAGETEFTPVAFSQDLSVLKLGQTVISLSGGERTNVSIGIVSAIDTSTAEQEDGSQTTTISKLDTDIEQDRLLFGSPLVDLFGEVVGVHTLASQGGSTSAGFTPISVVRAQMAQFVETQ